MSPVQLVLDTPLLRAIDRQAKKLSLSRSEFVRNAMREALSRIKYLEDIETERLAYERRPPSSAERATQKAAQKRQGAAVTVDGDDW